MPGLTELGAATVTVDWRRLDPTDIGETLDIITLGESTVIGFEFRENNPFDGRVLRFVGTVLVTVVAALTKIDARADVVAGTAARPVVPLFGITGLTGTG